MIIPDNCLNQGISNINPNIFLINFFYQRYIMIRKIGNFNTFSTLGFLDRKIFNPGQYKWMKDEY